MVGSYLNVIMPSSLIVTLLVLLLAAISVKTLMKARKLYIKESVLNANMQLNNDIQMTSVKHFLIETASDTDADKIEIAGVTNDEKVDDKHHQTLEYKTSTDGLFEGYILRSKIFLKTFSINL